MAVGVVSPDGSRKTVQHLEGGIVNEILVREGDRVEAGDVLVTLENIRALARFEETRDLLVFLRATEARLQSEEAGLDAIAFPEDLANDERRETQLVLLSQQELFDNRRETQLARERILDSRIDQLREEIAGLGEVIAAQDSQLELFAQELEAAESLSQQGLQRLPQLLELKRQYAGLQAQRAQNKSSIARLQQQIGEAELQILATRQQALEQISSEKAQIGSELLRVRSQLPEREDALNRTVIRAPISGRVLNVRVTTEQSGILRSGGEILDIVPEETDLIVDARVRPQDIENVYPGMPAQVILTAYNQRNLPRLFGVLDTISADRLVDERTGEPYFLAKVHVDAEDVTSLGDDVALIAGMPADVMLLTGERTMLDFLLKPFVDSIRQSFRES
jgi:HlyD family secretion protein/epimerase transport system membrane fusion protein